MPSNIAERNFEWFRLGRDTPGDLNEYQRLFAPAFLENPFYENKETGLCEVVKDERVYQSRDRILLTCREKGERIDLLLTSFAEYPKFVYVRQGAIHPEHKRQHIGADMMKQLQSLLSASNKMVVLTNKKIPKPKQCMPAFLSAVMMFLPYH